MQEDEIEIGGVFIPPGESRNIRLSVSETYLSTSMRIPVTVIHGSHPGRKLFLIAATHGDEVIGVAVIREIIKIVKPENLSGILICIPVANLPGFMNNMRETPDGRDLNRSFPGNRRGSMASRIAHRIYKEIILKCDCGIDIHSAAIGRLNYPQAKGMLKNKTVKKMALSLGTKIILDDKGPSGSLRRVATKNGIAVVTYEAGECLKFERKYVKSGIKGVKNVMKSLNMLKGKVDSRKKKVISKRSEWVRAERGGILESTSVPGKYVEEGDVIATVTDPFGTEVSNVKSPYSGYVISVVTRPLVHPGDPLCHIAVVKQ